MNDGVKFKDIKFIMRFIRGYYSYNGDDFDQLFG